MTSFLRVLADASIRINVVALAVGIAMMLARIRSSSVRHQAWLVVLCAMLSMPILPHVTPRVGIPIAAGPGAEVGNAAAADTGPIGMKPPGDLSPMPVAAAASPEQVETDRAAWPAILLGVYAVGVTAFLCRLLAGWLLARRVLGASRRISVQNTLVYESAQVSTPMTIGLRVRKILLPVYWSEWSEDKVRAVLAHELAHVERRDTITSFAAHLNRCLFWFHPLAWWLQRQLALTAEQACDDAGVSAIGGSRHYAEVLLDMAEAVHRRGNRMVCQGVGVDGTGLLGRRIDRILRADAVYSASGTQKALVALSCAAAVFVAAACHERAIYSAS
jgi:beta-lactamase regulating signal transducer with metallopeptidase domain